MLVLKRINLSTNYLVISKKNLNSFLENKNELYGISSLDIVDTETGEIIRDINKKNIKSILGVIVKFKDVLFISVDDYTWKFLDVVNSPVYMGKYINPDIFIMRKHKNSRLLVGGTSSGVDYQVYTGNILIVELFYDIKPLDKYAIFWDVQGLEYITILGFYEGIFEYIKNIDKYSIVYICSLTNNIYKLDLNKNVLRFMAKLRTLRC